MRVGLVIYGSLETVSGGYLYDRKLVEYLRQEGDQVEVISLPWRSYAASLADNLSGALYRRLSTGGWDRLLQDELNHPSLFWMNQRLRGGSHCPIISIVHHLRSSEKRPSWQNQFYAWIEGQYLRSVNAFICNSLTTRQSVHAVGKTVHDHPSLIAYPAGDQFQTQISMAEIVSRARQNGPLRIVFVGNLIPRKGLHILLAALRHLPVERFELIVVGDHQVDPAYTRRVRRQMERFGLAGRVELCGRLADDALARKLQAAHVLAVPSTYEGFGIVYLEGMQAGLPAIATTSGAAAEIITHGLDGFLIPPDDPIELSRCLEQLEADRGVLARMGQAARRRYQAHPTWEQTAGRIREFLL